MTDYIERQAVVNMLEEAQLISDGEYCGYCTEDVSIPSIPTANVRKDVRATWKYYHKQNKAVCTNCSFERDLDLNFGAAIACPNCGAYMEV